MPHVSFDNEGGVGEAVSHLTGLGHRRLGHVGGDLLSRSARQRRDAFVAACAERPDGVDGQLLGEFPPTFEGGMGAADAVLGSGVTAVIVYNDIMAIGLLHRLIAYGVPVPERLSVVGIDNIPVSAVVRPPLTTVELPRRDAGRIAAETMAALLVGSEPAPGDRLLPTHLVVRESTAALSPVTASARTD
ncbi:LacI family DNA-binding transcriptional regulator [Mariniluteicoccus flavus]